MNEELEMMWKAAIMAYFKVPRQQFLVGLRKP
jgi:hypothetical protein